MKLPSRSTLRALRYGSRLNPTRDWLLLLVGFGILLAVSLVWNLVQFSHVVNGQQIGTAPLPKEKHIDLTTVKQLFTHRSEERSRYETDYTFVDPSL